VSEKARELGVTLDDLRAWRPAKDNKTATKVKKTAKAASATKAKKPGKQTAEPPPADTEETPNA
jgi:hypothetical protein